MVVRNVTNLSTLNSAFALSVGGDVISMGPGNYGNFFGNKVFASEMIFKSADPLNPAVFNSFYSGNGNKFWTIEGIKIQYAYFAGQNDAAASLEFGQNCENMVVRKCELSGGLDPNGYGFGRAIFAIFSTNITVEDCKIHSFKNGIVFTNVTGCIARRNEIYDMGSDGIDFYACINGLIEGNYIHDFRPDYNSGAHCDAIQWATALGELITANITIRNNIIDIGQGAWFQNIFSNNEAFYGGGGNIYRYQGMVIENNYIRNAMQHGVTMGPCVSCIIRDNILIHMPMNLSQEYNNKSTTAVPVEHGGNFATIAIPRISIIDATGPCTVTNNKFYFGSFYTLNRVVLQASEASLISSGWTISGNETFKDTVGPNPPPFITFFGGSGGVNMTIGLVKFRGGHP